MGTLYRNGIPYVGSGGAGGVEVTQAEYDALPTSEKMNGSIYFITDGSVSYPTASQMRYDNTESGIPSTSVQGAIDELNNGLMHAETKTISVNDEGKTVIFNDISKIPVLIANQTSGQYPLFLPYLYGGEVRARVIDFSSNSWLLVQNVTLTVIVYYINNPQ